MQHVVLIPLLHTVCEHDCRTIMVAMQCAMLIPLLRAVCVHNSRSIVVTVLIATLVPLLRAGGFYHCWLIAVTMQAAIGVAPFLCTGRILHRPMRRVQFVDGAREPQAPAAAAQRSGRLRHVFFFAAQTRVANQLEKVIGQLEECRSICH
jgi:hypothetical protein